MSERADAWSWLEARVPGIPEPLRTRMRAAVLAESASGDTAGDLGRAALACLKEALEVGDTREAALHLLAADALVTHAAAAATLRGGSALATLADDWSAAALRARFRPETPA